MSPDKRQFFMAIPVARHWKKENRNPLKKRLPVFLGALRMISGGEGGIRTHDTGLCPYTPLAGERLRPARPPLRTIVRYRMSNCLYLNTFPVSSVVRSQRTKNTRRARPAQFCTRKKLRAQKNTAKIGTENTPAHGRIYKLLIQSFFPVPLPHSTTHLFP